MIKALFLIFGQTSAWEGIALSRRWLGLTVLLYLLPMMLIVALAEGYGLVEWGRVQSGYMSVLKHFTVKEACAYEAVQMFFMVVVIIVSAFLIKALGETFHGRNTYTQVFNVVIYGLSPIYLLRPLDMFPAMILWLPWAFGLILTMKVLYYGVPRVMEPDPAHAFGLYFMTCLILILATGLERAVDIGYQVGWFRPPAEVISAILHKLHL